MFYRNCPSCNNVVTHKSENWCNYSKRHDLLCHSCASRIKWSEQEYKNKNTLNKYGKSNPFFGKQHLQESKDKVSKAKTGVSLPPFTQEHKNRIGNANKGKPGHWLGKTFSYETKKKMSIASKGRKHSEESRNKMRESRKKLTTLLNGKPTFNEGCCDYLDVLNGIYADQGIHFRHALNHPDGEFTCLGYFADGYDINNNVWFEYDEPYHDYPYQKPKDLIRMKRIMGKLKCLVVRYSETTKEFRTFSQCPTSL